MGILVALDLYSGGTPLQHYEFSSDNQRLVRMGRLNSAQVRLDDPAASRIHAIIELSTTHAMLVDMGAEAGTFVNGKRATKVKLAHGDQITVGQTVLVVGLAVSTAAAGVSAVAPPLTTAPGASTGHADASSSDAKDRAAASTAGSMHPPAPATVARSGGAAASSVASLVNAGVSAAGQRVAGKVTMLQLDALLEVERYVDGLLWRQQGGTAARVSAGVPASTATVPGATASLTQGAASTSPSSEAAVARAVPLPSRDTQTQIAALRRGRRTQQLVIGGVLLVIAIVLAAIALSSDKGPLVSDEQRLKVGKPPVAGKPAGASAAPSGAAGSTTTAPLSAAAPKPAEPVSDDKTYVHRLTKDQSLRDLAAEIWSRADHEALLATANPEVAGSDKTLVKGTPVRIPRTMTYEVKAGDTLARIAEKTLGRSDAYRLIQDANKVTLPNANSLEKGMSLTIPLVNSEVEQRLVSPSTSAAPATPSVRVPRRVSPAPKPHETEEAPEPPEPVGAEDDEKPSEE